MSIREETNESFLFEWMNEWAHFCKLHHLKFSGVNSKNNINGNIFEKELIDIDLIKRHDDEMSDANNRLLLPPTIYFCYLIV